MKQKSPDSRPCKGLTCGEIIRFVTLNGKRTTISADPNGPIVVVGKDTAVILTPEQLATFVNVPPRYTLHASVCPDTAWLRMTARKSNRVIVHQTPYARRSA